MVVSYNGRPGCLLVWPFYYHLFKRKGLPSYLPSHTSLTGQFGEYGRHCQETDDDV
jgi:hypothetical protein